MEKKTIISIEELTEQEPREKSLSVEALAGEKGQSRIITGFNHTAWESDITRGGRKIANSANFVLLPYNIKGDKIKAVVYFDDSYLFSNENSTLKEVNCFSPLEADIEKLCKSTVENLNGLNNKLSLSKRIYLKDIEYSSKLDFNSKYAIRGICIGGAVGLAGMFGLAYISIDDAPLGILALLLLPLGIVVGALYDRSKVKRKKERKFEKNNILLKKVIDIKEYIRNNGINFSIDENLKNIIGSYEDDRIPALVPKNKIIRKGIIQSYPMIESVCKDTKLRNIYSKLYHDLIR